MNGRSSRRRLKRGECRPLGAATPPVVLPPGPPAQGPSTCESAVPKAESCRGNAVRASKVKEQWGLAADTSEEPKLARSAQVASIEALQSLEERFTKACQRLERVEMLLFSCSFEQFGEIDAKLKHRAGAAEFGPIEEESLCMRRTPLTRTAMPCALRGTEAHVITTVLEEVEESSDEKGEDNLGDLDLFTDIWFEGELAKVQAEEWCSEGIVTRGSASEGSGEMGLRPRHVEAADAHRRSTAEALVVVQTGTVAVGSGSSVTVPASKDTYDGSVQWCSTAANNEDWKFAESGERPVRPEEQDDDEELSFEDMLVRRGGSEVAVPPWFSPPPRVTDATADTATSSLHMGYRHCPWRGSSVRHG